MLYTFWSSLLKTETRNGFFPTNILSAIFITFITPSFPITITSSKSEHFSIASSFLSAYPANPSFLFMYKVSLATTTFEATILSNATNSPSSLTLNSVFRSRPLPYFFFNSLKYRIVYLVIWLSSPFTSSISSSKPLINSSARKESNFEILLIFISSRRSISSSVTSLWKILI